MRFTIPNRTNRKSIQRHQRGSIWEILKGSWCSIDLWQLRGAAAHDWADSLRSPAIVLQMGHVGVLDSQASRHLAWNVWLQAGRALHFSPPLLSNSSRQTAHDESVHDDPPTSNSKHGSFCSSSWDKPLPAWTGLRRRLWALPAIQRLSKSRNPRAPNNNKKDITAIDCRPSSVLPEAALLLILVASGTFQLGQPSTRHRHRPCFCEKPANSIYSYLSSFQNLWNCL